MSAFDGRVADFLTLDDIFDHGDRFAVLIFMHQNAGWRDAALTGIDHDPGDRWRQDFLQLGSGQDQIGRLAAQFLVHPFDRVGSRFRDQNAGTG